MSTPADTIYAARSCTSKHVLPKLKACTLSNGNHSLNAKMNLEAAFQNLKCWICPYYVIWSPVFQKLLMKAIKLSGFGPLISLNQGVFENCPLVLHMCSPYFPVHMCSPQKSIQKVFQQTRISLQKCSKSSKEAKSGFLLDEHCPWAASTW